MKVAKEMRCNSETPVVEKFIKFLRNFGIALKARVMSAQRTPQLALNFAQNAENNGFEVSIAPTDKSTHLSGVLAAVALPLVIGHPKNPLPLLVSFPLYLLQKHLNY